MLVLKRKLSPNRSNSTTVHNDKPSSKLDKDSPPEKPIVPSIESAERAAAAKAYIESRYTNLEFPYEDIVRDPSQLRRLRVLRTKGTAVRCDNVYHRSGLQLMRVLGKGSFGVVELVKQEESGRFYAMKVINKDSMLKNGQEAHLKCERDLLVQAARRQSDWVIQLLQSFQDHDNLYLVMDYMEGGDFLGLLLREDVLHESIAAWYIIEMISAVAELHRMGWVHRDLKPDNFLIANDGHLKIADFGLAFSRHWKHQQDYYTQHRLGLCDSLNIDVVGDSLDSKSSSDTSIPRLHHSIAIDEVAPRPYYTLSKQYDYLDHADWRRSFARSVVGTSQYMAPEVILGQSYDSCCDWWSIGIILYECLYGSTPFYDHHRDNIKQKVVHWHRFLKFPSKTRYNRPQSENPTPLPPVTPTAIDLICRLLINREKRLNLEGIYIHPWFRNRKWSEIRRYKPPFVPNCYGGAIDQWFESEDKIGLMKACDKRPRDKILRDPKCGPVALEIRKQTAFLGYTFTRAEGELWLEASA